MEREIPDPDIEQVWVTQSGALLVVKMTGWELMGFRHVREMLLMVGCEYLGEL